MPNEHSDSGLASMLKTVKPKTKQPISTRVLNTWIVQAEGQLGDDAKGGRLGWLIASSVAIAAVQRALDVDGRQLFLLKGGTLLQHWLNASARSTKDVDGLIRGDMDAFLLILENVLAEPWGPLALRRGAVEVIDVPTKIIKPRRFDIILNLRGVTWRRIQFEVSPDEAGIGEEHATIEVHAVSDPHEPPGSINDRARDVVDLLLLRDLAAATGSPTLAEIRAASVAVFEARLRESEELGQPMRSWPPTLVAHDHWSDDYARAATSGGIELSLDVAVAEVNAWIVTIAARSEEQGFPEGP